MSLSPDDIATITGLLAEAGPGPAAAQEIRKRYPKLAITRCDASDVTEDPYAVAGSFDLHLLDTRDHCVQLTTDPACATGLVLGQRKAV